MKSRNFGVNFPFYWLQQFQILSQNGVTISKITTFFAPTFFLSFGSELLVVGLSVGLSVGNWKILTIFDIQIQLYSELLIDFSLSCFYFDIEV